MSFKYPRHGTFVGTITTSFQYSTATGDIYDQFQHFPNGTGHSIMLHTRNSIVQEKYSNQLFSQRSKNPPWPHRAKVTIASDGFAFEVFEIEILDES